MLDFWADTIAGMIEVDLMVEVGSLELYVSYNCQEDIGNAEKTYKRTAVRQYFR